MNVYTYDLFEQFRKSDKAKNFLKPCIDAFKQFIAV